MAGWVGKQTHHMWKIKLSNHSGDRVHVSFGALLGRIWFMGRLPHNDEFIEPRPEPARKVGHSYKKVEQKAQREELFPKVLAEIDKKRKELQEGVKWPDDRAREGDGPDAALVQLAEDQGPEAGGSAEGRPGAGEEATAGRAGGDSAGAP